VAAAITRGREREREEEASTDLSFESVVPT
jgi:hypothetical protein